MGTERIGLALVLAIGMGAPLGAAPTRAFDAPTGLTLVAQGGGRYVMVWDPIYRDDLLGYSVWLRKPGEREFTRLSIPVRVGKEIKKEPLTSEAKVVLAFGRERKDLEMTVVASYEDGDSLRGRVLRSGAARREETVTGAPEAPSATSTVGERNAALADAGAPAPGGEAPWDKQRERAARPLILPPGQWRSRLGVGFDYRQFTNGGYDPFGSLGLIGTNITPTAMVSWTRTDVRTAFNVPLSLSYGLFPGVEAWGQVSYRAEDYFVGDFKVNGQDFSYIQFEHVNSNGSIVTLSNPSSTGLGDSQVGVKAQPVPGQPLVLGISATLPSGISRFKSMLDWFAGRGSPAGTGDGIVRLTFGADWGYKGGPSGLSFHGAFSPGAAERYALDNASGGPLQDQVLTHGDLVELGGAYTFPWVLVGRSGALALGLTGRSQAVDQWTTNGVSQAPLLPHVYHTAFEAASGLKFERDDQLEFSLEAFQDLPGGFETGGSLSYTLEAFGDRFTVAGQFLY